MKILIAVDGSAWTQRMLDFIDANRELLDSRHAYTLLYVVAQLPVHVEAMAEGGPEAVRRYYDEELQKVLEPTRSALVRNGMSVRAEGRVGAAAEVIAEVAQTGGFDLLVMGSRGFGALTGFILGSVTAKVLALCKTPMLLVR